MLIPNAAIAVCAQFNEEPDGSQVRLLNDGMHSETFLARNSRAALAVAKVIREALQVHAENQPIEDYGRFRPAVEWLDEQIKAA